MYQTPCPFHPVQLCRAWLAALLCALAFVLAALPAFAADADDLLQVRSYRMAGDAARMRVVVNYDRDPAFRWFVMKAPHRLVIDMPEAGFFVDAADIAPRGMVTAVQYGNLGPDRSRIILSFDGPFAVERLDLLANESDRGSRLVADIVASTDEAFDQAMAEQVETTASTRTAPKTDRLGKPVAAGERQFRVVVDPGHGGVDTGAEGGGGTLEKTITLAFALELKKELEAGGRYDVFLTRDRDVFLRLDVRVAIARRHGADLFISIHADAIRLKNVRGATVYTVSDKASDAEAAAKAIRENLSDQIAGIAVEEEIPEVADILADLIRRETQSFSLRFARSLVGGLSTAIRMIPTNPHRFAGFKVLRAPDVPSVLLELGYLSNVEDEALMRDAGWRAKAARGIVEAVDLFAAAHRGAGG
jgi:N-acetylmuramoyl-L-alanine amidase